MTEEEIGRSDSEPSTTAGDVRDFILERTLSASATGLLGLERRLTEEDFGYSILEGSTTEGG